MTEQPAWLSLGDSLLGPLIAAASLALENFEGPDFHITQLPNLALHHLAQSLGVSVEANRHGQHAVALALLRHAIEALTIVELGLVGGAESYRQLEGWDVGKRSQGELRKSLAANTWPNYGTGLWDEPWGDYFGTLAKAVQPYAHFSPELLQWNLAILNERPSGPQIAVPGSYDPMKASRLTLFHVLVTWTLGRLLFANHPSGGDKTLSSAVTDLGFALSRSEYLFQGRDWSHQLFPHMFFRR